MENKLRIGDIVIGNKKADIYGITKPNTKWEVLDIKGSAIIVGWVDETWKKKMSDKALRDWGGPINEEFIVDTRYFDLFHEDLSEDTLTKKIKERYEKQI